MICFSQLKGAARRIRKYIRRTPLEHSTYLSRICRGEVYLKLENQQVTGSFKVRGALNKVLSMPSAKRDGIVAASSGNHGIGVAYACSLSGAKPTVVLPKTAPKTKIESLLSYGARVILHGKSFEDAEERAIELSKKEGRTFVSAYNDEKIIAGQGTVALEIIQEAPDADMIICPAGQGGLLAGCLIAARHRKKRLYVVGVQSANSPQLAASLHAGTLLHINPKPTIAEGLEGNLVQKSKTWSIIKKHCDGMLLVTEREIREAIKLMLRRHHMLIEPSAAVGVAALLKHTKLFSHKRVIVVVTGSNIDISTLRKAIR